VRVITDDAGTATLSLGYDGDWGSTRVSGQDYAASYGTVASLYRYKGQEQEIFPLGTLNIEDSALAAWLDELQLYHFPLRDYASGLAAFLQTDPIPSEDSLYAAFGANPANFGDDNGAMLEEGADDSERIEQLLDQLLQDPQARFEDRDRALLRRRLSTVERGVQNLVSQSEALMHRITDIRQQVQQTEAVLQTAREQQISYHAINLFSQHIREGRAQRIRQGERNQYIAVIRHTAEDLSNRRMSALERRLSDRYFQLLRSEDSLQGELQMVDAERQGLEGWLDIYQVVIERMWDPDETPSEAEDDDDDYDVDEDIDVHSRSSSASESDDDAGSAGRQIEPNEHGGEEQRRSNSRNADGQDDEKAE
ncbi:MAG TPA: hypothetical protein VKA79_04035, partial [Aestuariivirgaceae bacterium]|nr:hypothetical protein [Aestuariivirgaceae bacterium]